MDEKSPYVLIDARPKRVADGHDPTTLNISDTEFDKQVRQAGRQATPLIYYCGGLECVLSDKSAEKAKKLGYTNVLISARLSGLGKIHGAPAPTVAAAAGAAPATVTAALVPGKEKGSVTVASFEQVWKTNPGSIVLVDVRDPKEVAAGTIKGSVNIPMNELRRRSPRCRPTNRWSSSAAPAHARARPATPSSCSAAR